MPSISIAEELAKKQREISVSEFFERNKQILGYDSPTKALLTVVKEAVDNSVEHDEPVILRENGWIRLVRIGEFIDAKISGREGETHGEEERTSVPLSNCEVLAYDDTTMKASFRPATSAYRHRVRGPLYEIELVGGRKVTVTGSHSVFGLASHRIVALRVEDLRVGDYVVVPNREILLGDGISEVDLRPWLMSLSDEDAKRIMIHGLASRLPGIPRDWRRFDFVPLAYIRERKLPIPPDVRITVRFGKSRLPVVLPVSHELMRFLGLYAAEGTRLDATILLSFGSHEKSLIEETKRLIVQAFGSETHVSSVPAHRTAVCVKAYSKILSRVLRDVFNCGDRAAAKRIPDLVFNVSRHLQESFLQGYIDGDGHRGTQKITVATVSGELAWGLSHLFAMLGKAFSLSARPSTSRTFPGGYRSRCRVAYYLYLYGSTAPQGQPNAPLFWLPLEETGFRQVVGAWNPLKSYNTPMFKDMKSRPRYTISKFAASLEQAEEYARSDFPAELRGQRAFLERLVFGDVGFLQVRSIRKVQSPHRFVYDFSVPGPEKFLGGRGAIFLHNTLDACEEAEILPDVQVQVTKTNKDEFLVKVEDNGPGIVKKEVPNVFGRLLYGSRFHARRQARGAQGLGISGAVMFGQLTTGKPAKITSKTAEMDVAYQVELILDTKKNRPSLVSEDFIVWEKAHGTRVELSLKGRYVGGKQSISEYLKATAIVNPHARITYTPPEGDPIVFDRATEDLPPKTKEIPPHPHGIELGTLMQMMKETKSYKLATFMEEEFVRVSARVAKEICDSAGLNPDMKPKSLVLEQAKALHEAMQSAKLMAPPTDCLSPIGERLIKRGLKNVLGNLRPEFYAPPLTRDPSVYSGNPFQVEVGIVFGGDLPPDQPVEVLRFANRVPLMYQAGGCALTQAVANVDWRRYGLEQRGGSGLPFGPAIVLVHVCSTKVPFTSEAKEAVATVDEIMTELDLALKECGRRLKTHLTKKAHRAKTKEKFEIVQLILPRIADKSAKIVNKKVPVLDATITKIMGVVWVDEQIAYDKKEKRHTVTINVHNFTAAGKKLNLHLLLPRGIDPKSIDPKPAEVRDDGKITWELKRIDSVAKASISFILEGLDEAEYDESDLYVSGINPGLVIGAEPLPGDWELNYAEFEEEEAPTAEAAEETEIDYDETEEALDDD
jgi:DNA topoisomerase-6 subunit B